jgi:lysophospholipase L1-like esterase
MFGTNEIGVATPGPISTKQTIAGWVVFEKDLSDTELVDVIELMWQTLFPRMIMLLEGDSLFGNTSGIGKKLLRTPTLWGANIQKVDLHAGGQTASQMAEQIGTPDGINDDYLGSPYPVLCMIWGGQNGLNSNETLSQKKNALLALWNAARHRGMTVVAWTVTPNKTRDDAGQSDVITDLNDWIRSRSDKYDLLIDAYQWVVDEAGGPQPYIGGTNEDADLYQDGVHLNAAEGKGADRLAAYAAAQLASNGFVR